MALEEGNVKSELILGLRRIRSRQARLKLVAELVDPGANPLKTHGAKSADAVTDKSATDRRPENQTNAPVVEELPSEKMTTDETVA